VFLSGRPLYVNHELNASDAFVAGWLPGTEGAGVADLLVSGANTGAGFTGQLSYSWPKTICQTPLNVGDAAYEPLFPFGYGLHNGQVATVGQQTEESQARCGNTGGGGTATEDLELFVRHDIPPYHAFIGSPENWGGTAIGDDVNAVTAHANISVRWVDVNVQQDGHEATFKGGPAQYYIQSDPADLRSYLNANSALVFDTKVTQAPTARTVISMHCEYPCFSEVVATNLFTSIATSGVKQTVKIPVSCFDTGTLEYDHINTPFLVYTEGQLTAAFANVRWVPGAANDADAVSCASLQ
jgi:beta-glucosidase